MKGKEKCKALKEIRKQIAENNDIKYVVDECEHKGDCKGTCPKCEAEVRYLEKELEKKRVLGQKVAIAGVSLGVAATFSACTTSIGDILPFGKGAPSVYEEDLGGATEIDPDEELLGEPIEIIHEDEIQDDESDITSDDELSDEEKDSDDELSDEDKDSDENSSDEDKESNLDSNKDSDDEESNEEECEIISVN